MLNFKEQAEQLHYEKRIVMGAVPFKDTIDGKQIDVCNVFIAAPFDRERGAIGFGTAKVGFGASQNIHRFEGVELPCLMEVAFHTITSGSGKSKTVIKDVRPVRTAPKG